MAHPSPAKSGRVQTIQVGAIREVDTGKRTVTTGIYKELVEGPIEASGVNLAGDDQADRKVHGGHHMAVYAFPSEHYPSWREAFPDAEWAPGAFGENLTIEGLLESDVAVGDRFRCGTAEFVVTQPRLPCFKFAHRIGHPLAVKHMMQTRETGFYFSIERAGTLQSGDALEYLDGPSSDRLTITEFVTLYRDKNGDAEAFRRAAEAPGLSESWREWFLERSD